MEGIDFKYADEYLETLAVYRKLVEYLIDYHIVLLHGSAVAVDGEAYLFVAQSGTGKSTHAKLWREFMGKRVIMVNDDKPLLEIKEKEVFVYGTSWDGKHHLNTNVSIPVKGICVLHRAEENYIKIENQQNAYMELFKQVYRPKSKVKLQRVLCSLDRIVQQIPVYG